MLRRGFIGGLVGLLAAPAIIRTPGLLMPVKVPIWPVTPMALVNPMTGHSIPIPVTPASDLFAMMAEFSFRLASGKSGAEYSFVCSREIRAAMDVQAMQYRNVLLQPEKAMPPPQCDTFRGIPILLAGELA